LSVAFVFGGGVQRVGEGVRPNEIVAIQTLVTLNVAHTQYFEAYRRYAASLAELGPPADLIPASLVAGVKSGYKFTMVGSPQGYTVNAEPEVFHTTGTRSFFTDQSGVIREHIGKGSASVDDPEIK
jgi:hypothetical protein